MKLFHSVSRSAWLARQPFITLRHREWHGRRAGRPRHRGQYHWRISPRTQSWSALSWDSKTSGRKRRDGRLVVILTLPCKLLDPFFWLTKNMDHHCAVIFLYLEGHLAMLIITAFSLDSKWSSISSPIVKKRCLGVSTGNSIISPVFTAYCQKTSQRPNWCFLDLKHILKGSNTRWSQRLKPTPFLEHDHQSERSPKWCHKGHFF